MTTQEILQLQLLQPQLLLLLPLPVHVRTTGGTTPLDLLSVESRRTRQVAGTV